jgi:hypothetical protein
MTAKKLDLEEIAALVREFLSCVEGQPGRAKQIAEELAALLPAPAK